MNHLRNMYGYFLVASLVVLFTCVNVTGSWLLAVLAMALTSAVGLAGGLGSTIFLRGAMSLMQTGRLIQYLAFWGFTYLGLKLMAWLFATAFVVSSPLGASLLLFGLAFGAATLTGEVPTRGRTWLPVRRKQG